MNTPDRKLRRRIQSLFDLPRDVSMNLPRLVVLGNEQILLENHRGLVKYDPQGVLVGAGGFQVWVEGEGLFIESADPETIKILGTIKKICFEV